MGTDAKSSLAVFSGCNTDNRKRIEVSTEKKICASQQIAKYIPV